MVLIKTNVLRFAALLMMLFVGFAATNAQGKLKKWKTFDFAKQKVTAAQIKTLDHEDLQQLRGIVFGKHGRIFKETTIQEYLEKRAWYKPNPKFANSQLNAVERQNLDTIRLTEAAIHDRVEPGDLRYWENTAIPEDKISANTAAEWRIMIAEIEAIHGKTFPDEPWLQKYFEERYWYQANPKYSPTKLNNFEKQNIEAIAKKRDEDRKVAVSPGDMDKFQTVLLTEKILDGVTINDLRLMKNEFYARHGKVFAAAGIQAYFTWQEWYRPITNQKSIKLSEVEQQNVSLLDLREAKEREKFGTKELKEGELDGLFTEDLRTLRNEIYARHGKVFRSKDLKEYFAAQPWYKPNPTFQDEMLSDVEKANLVVIKEAEDQAASKFAEVEG